MPIIYNLLLWHVLQYPWSLFVITYREHLAGRIIYYPLPIFSFTFATDFVSIMISIEWSKRILIFVRSSLLRSRNVRMLHPATKNWTSEMTQYVDIYMYIYILKMWSETWKSRYRGFVEHVECSHELHGPTWQQNTLNSYRCEEGKGKGKGKYLGIQWKKLEIEINEFSHFHYPMTT